jgi:E-phenylitaconyl-CoA hydratase
VTEVVPREGLRERAREIALGIAARNPKAIQGTIRAIWESMEMPRSTALHNGLSYTQIGNEGASSFAPGPKRETQYR